VLGRALPRLSDDLDVAQLRVVLMAVVREDAQLDPPCPSRHPQTDSLPNLSLRKRRFRDDLEAGGRALGRE
jgi:hypothetical protein